MVTEREGFFVSSQGCITFFVTGTSKFYVLYTMRHNRVNASLRECNVFCFTLVLQILIGTEWLKLSSMSVNLEYSLTLP